jgi:hypothetical protein
MALTLPNPSSACRSFCENDHKFQGIVDKLLKAVDNPATLRACIFIQSSEYLCLRFRVYFFLLRTGVAAFDLRNS